MAHGGRQRGGWTDQCSGTDPGAVQPARDGRVRHGYPYRSDPQARSHAVRPLPQDGPRGLPHHVSREAAVFKVMLTRGYSGTRAGTFITPIPGAIARAMKRRPRWGPRPNGRAQRCPCPPALVRVRANRRSPMRIDSGVVEPFDFAPVGARQPTSRARVLEDSMGRAARMATSSRINRWSAAMPQPNDLSRSLVALDHNSTIIAIVELSQSSWLVGG